MKEKCFRFSVDVRVGDNWTEILKWLHHFDRTGMPAGIVLCDEYLCVWRAGERLVTGETPKHDRPQGVLQASVNGFENLWSALGGSVATVEDKKMKYVRSA